MSLHNFSNHAVIVFCDAPDPDNWVLAQAASFMRNSDVQLYVVLTGRPLRFEAEKKHEKWDWDMQSSQMAQKASAWRLIQYMRATGYGWGYDGAIRIFDGGIAPRTLVPHHIHFKEYYKFNDVDPFTALRYNSLEGVEELIKIVLALDSCTVLVGGPMTGLMLMLQRNPAVAAKFDSVYAMYGTWGNVKLMDMGDGPRGALQFNVACDPFAGNYVFQSLACPIYLLPTEVTRVQEIGFSTAIEFEQFLDGKNKPLLDLYKIWYQNAVAPRQMQNPEEKIFIHDVAPAFASSEQSRNEIYEIVPIRVVDIPHLPSQSADWGKLIMKELPAGTATNRFAAKSLKPGGVEKYKRLLYDVCTQCAYPYA